MLEHTGARTPEEAGGGVPGGYFGTGGTPEPGGAGGCWRHPRTGGVLALPPPQGPVLHPPRCSWGQQRWGQAPWGRVPSPGGGPRRNPGATPQRGGCRGHMGTGRKSDFLKSHQDKTRARRGRDRLGVTVTGGLRPPGVGTGWGGGSWGSQAPPPPEDLGLAPGRLLPCGWCWTRWRRRLWAGRRHSGGGRGPGSQEGRGQGWPKRVCVCPPPSVLGAHLAPAGAIPPRRCACAGRGARGAPPRRATAPRWTPGW